MDTIKSKLTSSVHGALSLCTLLVDHPLANASETKNKCGDNGDGGLYGMANELEICLTGEVDQVGQINQPFEAL